MAKTNITPPIRVALLTQNGAPLTIGTAEVQTTRDWWMYWNQLGDQANANSKLVSDGAHSDRPITDNVPEGALFVENDRGVIYQNQGGNWQYVAGTMYGTLEPDQRPTDLGIYDGGFEFRATDSDPANTGRDFIWAETKWIETTAVLYNTHALRPDPADAPARCLYVEIDRGSVMYQNQAGAWQYLTGTMYGTLTPDERPTDLGPADAGFTFKTNVDPSQTFVWNGGQWDETTPARYGTHAGRLAAPVAEMVSGMLWTETDRGNVTYQNQAGTWVYLAGTMTGTILPDQRPTDLGANDTGFDFRTSVAPLREFTWSGTAWLETTPSAQIAYASGSLVLTTTASNIPGATLSLPQIGRYLITGNFSFLAVDPSVTLRGMLVFNGATQPGGILANSANNVTYIPASQQWFVTTTAAGQVATLQGSKDAGTGTSQINGSFTTMTALYLGP